MPDWRNGGDAPKKPQPGKTRKVVPGQPPPASEQPGQSSQSSRPARGGWRKRGASTGPAAGAAGGGRSWQGAGRGDEPVSGGTLRRWLLLSLLSVATLVLTGYFVWWVFFSPNKLPLRVVSVGRMASAELQENLFGNAERNAWLKINSDNIEASTAVDNENDNQLSKLVNEDWLVEKGSGGWRGGGPRRQIAAFYINATAVTRPRTDGTPGAPGLWLVPQSGQPWAAGDSPEKSLVEIGDVLRNVAGSVRAPAWVWLVLDLQAPGPLPEGGDFACCWASRLREVLADMAKDPTAVKLHDRLIVTLACDNGQQNWLAPEYGATFFGHWFKLGLSGAIPPDRPLFSALSLGQFQREFDRLVKTSVASRRYAIQTPVWLPEANLKAQADRLQLVSVHKAQPWSPAPFAPLAERFGSLDALWETLQSQRPDAWRWDPVGTASAESRLIGLDALCLGASDAAVIDAVTQARQAIERIAMPLAPPPVSLVEQLAQRIYRAGQSGVVDSLASPLAGSDADRWLDPPPVAPAGGEQADPPGLEIAVASRPEFVWRWLVKQADAGLWQRFDRATLDKALVYAGPNAADWVELQLVRLLRDETEWAGISDVRSEAVGRAIRVFDRVQQSGTASPAELATWVRDEQREVELQFQQGVDRLLAGQVAASQALLFEADSAAQRLGTKTTRLAELLTARDEALYLVPQLVQWSLGQYQFAEPADELPAIKLRLIRLAEAWELARNVGATGQRATLWPDDPAALHSHFGLVDQVRALREEFETQVRELVDADAAAKSNPRTFRQIGLVLKTALVRADDRRNLHKVIDQFLAAASSAPTESSAMEDPPHRAWELGLADFVAALKEPDSQSFWPAALQGGLRRTMAGNAFFADEPRPTALEGVTTPLQLRDQLFQAGQFVRARAGVFGSLITGQEERRTRWPWTAAAQCSAFDAAIQFQLQRDRLVQSAWGDGALPEPNPLCLRLADQYLLPPLESVGELGGRGLAQMATTWTADRQALLDRLDRLVVRMGTSQRRVLASEATVAGPLTIPGGNDWGGGVAEVVIANAGAGIAQLLPVRSSVLSSSPDAPAQPIDRLAIPLDAPEATGSGPREVAAEVDATGWNRAGPPQLRVAWRGNSRIVPVDWIAVEQKREPYVLESSRGPVEPSTITVLPPDEPPVINVLLLIDCSSSTDSQIDLVLEEGARRMLLFELLQETARSFINRLAELHGSRDVDVQLNIMPFGYTLPPDRPQELLVALARHDGTLNSQPQIFQTRFQPLEARWQRDVLACIDGLSPAGQTPLYSAVVHATRELQKRPGAKLIFVLSDGVNDIDRRFQDDAKSILEVEKGLETLEDGLLKVFYFDNFASYLQKKLAEYETQLRSDAGDEPLADFDRQRIVRRRGEYESVERTGLEELNGLAQRRPERALFRQQTPGSFQSLIDEFLASVPDIDVQAIARINGTEETLASVREGNHRRYTLRPDQMPCDVTVSVVSEFFGDIQPRALTLEGGESIKLRFDRTAQPPRLGFPDFATDDESGLELAQGDFSSSGMKLHYRSAVPDQDDRNVSYQLGFERTDGSFTRRPEYMVLQLETAKPSGRILLTPDLRFMPGRHYPVAEFNAFLQLPVPDPRATVWWAPVVPDCVVRATWPEGAWTTVDREDLQDQLATGLQKLGLTGVTVLIKRDFEKLNCVVEYPENHPDNQRLVVTCPAAERVVRTVTEESIADPDGAAARVQVRREENVFELLEGRQSLKVELWLATPAVLEGWVLDHPDQLWKFVPPPVQ